MKRLLTPALAFAATIVLATTSSADEVQFEFVVKDTIKKNAKPVRRPTPRVIIVTADGKSREFQLDEQSIQNLTKGIRVRIDHAVKGNATQDKSTRGAKNSQQSGSSQSSSKSSKQFSRQSSGRAVIVGPDGKRREFKFSDDELDGKVLQGLPKNLREQILRSMKAQHGKGKATAGSFGRAFMIGPDGKKREIKFGTGANSLHLKGLPQEIRVRIQKALTHKGVHEHRIQTTNRGIIIGPDGEKHEFKIDGRNSGEKIEILVQQLPANVREEVRKAMALQFKRVHSHSHAEHAHSHDKKPSPDKLDLILKRLNQLQKQVDALQKKIGK